MADPGHRARSASSPPTTTVRPEYRELYARLCIAIGGARLGAAVLPHAAARAAKHFLAGGGAAELESGALSLDEAAAAALRDYEASGASVKAAPPSSPQRAAEAQAEAEAARGGRTRELSAEERKAMYDAYGQTMLGPKANPKSRLEPADLVWSPMKPFKAPPKAKLRAPTTGLW